MSIEIDSPYRRLPWTLPSALLVCAVVFVLFAKTLMEPGKHPRQPEPVNAELVELPPPAKPKPAPPAKKVAPVKPVRAKQPASPPAPEKAPPPPETAPPPHAQAAPKPVAPVVNTNSPPGESRGAQALVQPLPTIPDELREEAMDETATARFHIGPDGTVSVELLKPTQYPRLNRLLLETLRRWKFFPAMKDGKPVASVQDVNVKLQVK